MKQRGYTLVEMIVSIGLLALLLLAIVELSLSMAKSHERSSQYLEINSAAASAFSRFSRDIRRATSVDISDSVLDASAGKLVLEMKKEDGTDDTTAFYLADGSIKESYNGTLIGNITPASADISNLTFRLFQIATTTAIRVEMTISPSASSSVPVHNFYGTYVLRGSYVE